jgi:hypothetical protein
VRDAVHSITEVKPTAAVLYSCELCARQFSSPEVLQLHKASSHPAASTPAGDSHLPNVEFQMVAPEMPEPVFACTFCEASYADRAGLDQHTLTEHAALLELVDENPVPGISFFLLFLYTDLH